MFNFWIVLLLSISAQCLAQYTAELAAVSALGTDASMLSAPSIYGFNSSTYTPGSGTEELDLPTAILIDAAGAQPTTISAGDYKYIYYDAKDYQGNPTRAFAVVKVPANASSMNKVPGIVCVHGGGGSAFTDWADNWANRGYAVISIAVEGQVNRKDGNYPAINTNWNMHNMGGPVRSGIYNDTDILPFEDQWMYHSVADAVLANSLLRSLPFVDSTKIGIMGVSWGGVITSTTIGIDNRFAFAIPTYGCGHKFDSSNNYGINLFGDPIYEQVWDPVLRISNATMPTLWFSWPQEGHFPLDSHAYTYHAQNGTYMVSLVNNMGHGHFSAWNRPESYDFADAVVNNGNPWCTQQSLNLIGSTISAVFASTKPLHSASLISTTDFDTYPPTGIATSQTWTETPIDAPIDNLDGTYSVTATLPTGTKAYFVNVEANSSDTDDDSVNYGYSDSNIVVSSDFREINKVVFINTDSSNLVSNGNFETPDIATDSDTGGSNGIAPVNVGSTNLTDWAVSGNRVYIIDGFDNFDADNNAIASEGDQFMTLQYNGGPSTISQTISTVAGENYTLSFDYGGIYLADKTVDLTYTIDGISNSLSIDLIDLAVGQVPWQNHLVDFTSTGNTTISFTGDFNAGLWGPGIDNVKLMPTTELEIFHSLNDVSTTDTIEIANEGASPFPIVSMSFSNESHPGSFTTLSEMPLYLNESSPAKTPIEIVFDNSIANLCADQFATALFTIEWEEVDGSTNQTQLPVKAIIEPGLDCDNGVQLNAKSFLQGAFDNTQNLMRDDLRMQGFIPLEQPYSLLSNFQYNGTEQTTQSVLNQSGPDAIVDWIIVELRNENNQSQILETRAALLQRDGDIVDTDGISPVSFEAPVAAYFICLRHRNHLGIMTEQSHTLSPGEIIDFTNLNLNTYGQDAMLNLNNSQMLMWAGDGNSDGKIIFQGGINDPNEVFFGVLVAPGNTNTLLNYVQEGYFESDVNMDGKIIYQGIDNEPNTIFFNVLSFPQNSTNLVNYTIEEQLP